MSPDTPSEAPLPAIIATPARKKRKVSRILVVLTGASLVVFAGLALYDYILSQPPAPNVVAIFEGGQITVDDLKSHLALLTGQEAESLGNINGKTLQSITEEMIFDELARRWGTLRKAEKEEQISHQMVHVNDEIDLSAWHESMHKSGMGINQSDIEAYFNANKASFGEKSLNEVRDEIERILKSQGEDSFVRDYVASLRNTADIQRNFAVLEVPEPSSEEILDFYRANEKHFTIPEVALVDQIRIDASENRSQAQGAADRIRQRLFAGADSASALGEDIKVAELREDLKISRDLVGDPQLVAAAFEVSPGQTAATYESEGSLYLVRLKKRTPSRQLELADVSEEVRGETSNQKLTLWFEDRKDSPVFYVNGVRLSAGEFWQEYQELPEDHRVPFLGSAGRKLLAEKLIDRYLVVMESSQKKAGESPLAKETRTQLIKKLIDKEEIDGQVKATEEEVRAYYEANRFRFTPPPKSQVRQIQFTIAATDSGAKEALSLAEDAYRKLVPGWLQTGLSFGQVAQEYGVASGGDPVWIGEERELNREIGEHTLHQNIEQIPVGQIGRPFIAGDSVYIVQVLDRAKATPLPLSEIRQYIEEELKNQKHERLMDEFIAKLFQKNGVRIYEAPLATLLSNTPVGDTQAKQ